MRNLRNDLESGVMRLCDEVNAKICVNITKNIWFGAVDLREEIEGKFKRLIRQFPNKIVTVDEHLNFPSKWRTTWCEVRPSSGIVVRTINTTFRDFEEHWRKRAGENPAR